MMTKESQKLYDMYASAALSAMIAKFPPLGISATDEEKDELRTGICNGAHLYACKMMEMRFSFITRITEFAHEDKDNA